MSCRGFSSGPSVRHRQTAQSFCRHARQLESHFRALKGKSNDLVGWIASVVQSIHLPFIAPSHRSVCVVFSGEASLEKESSPGMRQGGAVVPLNSDRAHIVYAGNGALGAGRRGLRIVHGMQGDAGSGRVLPPEAFHLFSCRPLVQTIISFVFLDFGLPFAVLLFSRCSRRRCSSICAACSRFSISIEWISMFRHSLAVWRSFFNRSVRDADLRRARFIAIELLALLYEDSDFILRFLPNGGKLAPVLYVVLKMNSACSIRLSSLRISSRTA